MHSPIRVRRDNGILEVIIDRPKANAIDLATSREMGVIFRDFRDDPELRVAIISGAGEKILFGRLGFEGRRCRRCGRW